MWQFEYAPLTEEQSAVLERHYEKHKVTCWLCGGPSTQACRCHNAPKDGKPKSCDMVCNERTPKTSPK